MCRLIWVVDGDTCQLVPFAEHRHIYDWCKIKKRNRDTIYICNEYYLIPIHYQLWPNQHTTQIITLLYRISKIMAILFHPPGYCHYTNIWCLHCFLKSVFRTFVIYPLILLYYFKVNVDTNEMPQTVWSRSGLTFCWSWPGSKLFAKVTSVKTKVDASKEGVLNDQT